jgi:hypothetical protein
MKSWHIPGVVLLLLLAWTGRPQAADIAGNVLAVGGDCILETGGQRQPLKMKDAVHVGDTVVVPGNGKLKLHMVDGSVLSAAAGTTLTIAAYTVDAATGQREARLSLSGGLLRSVVQSMAGPSRFEVTAATAVAAVRSTDWFIESGAKITRVGVLTGRVGLISRGTGVAVDIPDRYGARVESGQDPMPPRPWKDEEFEEYIQMTALP